VRPGDKVLIVLPDATSHEHVKNFVSGLREVFGDDRVVVIGGDVRVAVVQGDEVAESEDDRG
jgi:thiamine monophosphate kinase